MPPTGGICGIECGVGDAAATDVGEWQQQGRSEEKNLVSWLRVVRLRRIRLCFFFGFASRACHDLCRAGCWAILPFELRQRLGLSRLASFHFSRVTLRSAFYHSTQNRRHLHLQRHHHWQYQHLLTFIVVGIIITTNSSIPYSAPTILHAPPCPNLRA